MATSDIKKMKQGMSYSCKEKTIILNVFKYLKIIFPEKCVTDLVRQTSRATGCSEKSIFRFRKEEVSAEGFRAPSKTKVRKNININSRDNKYDECVRQSIKKIVYDLKYKNVSPSLNTILRTMKLDTQLPEFSLMTLRRLLFDMGFTYEKVGNKSVLVEKSKQELVAKPKNKTSVKKNKENEEMVRSPVDDVQCFKPMLPKPTPHHPVPYINSHNVPLNQLGEQPYNNYHQQNSHSKPCENSHTIMNHPVYSQPLPHNMPMIVNHHQGIPTNYPHMLHHPNFDKNLPRGELLGI